MSTRSSGPVQSRRLGPLQQHPLACFFVLTYSAAWFLWIGNFPGTPKGRHAVLAIGPTAKPGTGRPPGTAWRSSDAFVSTAMMKTVEPQQPGYLPHSEAVAAPMDRLTQRKALVVGHRPQSLPSAPLRVPDESIAFAERGQHRDRQTFEPAFPLGAFFAQDRPGI